MGQGISYLVSGFVTTHDITSFRKGKPQSTNPLAQLSPSNVITLLWKPQSIYFDDLPILKIVIRNHVQLPVDRPENIDPS